MMDINEIRHANVRLLVRRLEDADGRTGGRAGGMTKLAARLGKSTGQVAHFAGESPIKPIGNQIAREIEVAMGLEPGWMDWLQDGSSPAPQRESRSVRLDPEMMAELATVLGERMKTVGGFDLRNEDHAAHFVQCYELFINMKEQPTPENVVEFSSALISPQGATANEQGKDVPAEGTAGQGVRKGARRRAGT